MISPQLVCLLVTAAVVVGTLVYHVYIEEKPQAFKSRRRRSDSPRRYYRSSSPPIPCPFSSAPPRKDVKKKSEDSLCSSTQTTNKPYSQGQSPSRISSPQSSVTQSSVIDTHSCFPVNNSRTESPVNNSRTESPVNNSRTQSPVNDSPTKSFVNNSTTQCLVNDSLTQSPANVPRPQSPNSFSENAQLPDDILSFTSETIDDLGSVSPISSTTSSSNSYSPRCLSPDSSSSNFSDDYIPQSIILTTAASPGLNNNQLCKSCGKKPAVEFLPCKHVVFCKKHVNYYLKKAERNKLDQLCTVCNEIIMKI